MQKKLSKVLAFVLSLAVVFSYMPAMPVYADGGIAAQHTIIKAGGNWNNSAYDIEIDPEWTDELFGHLVSVNVNGSVIPKDKFFHKDLFDVIRTEDEETIALFAGASKEDITLVFDDTANDNGGGDEGDDNNNGGGEGNTNIADKYTIEEINKSAWGDDINVEIVDDAFTDGDFAEVTKVVINGDTYTDKSQMRNYYGDFRISGADVVASYQKTTPVSMAIFFSDGSLLKTDNFDENDIGGGDEGDDNNNGGGEDDTTIADKYTIEEINKSAWGDDINVEIVDDAFTDGDFAEVTKVVINGDTYTDKSQMRNYYGDFRISGADVVASYQKTTPVSMAIFFSDGSLLKTDNFDENDIGGGDDGNNGEDTVNADGTVLTFADGSTLSISGVSKDQTIVALSFAYTPKDDTSKTFTERLEAIEAITIDNYEVALKDAFGYSTYFASEENQTVSWFKPSERQYNETAWDLVENFDKYQSHGAIVTFTGENTISFGTPIMKDNTLSKTYQIENVTVADLGDGKKVLISFTEPNNMMTAEDFDLISQIEIDGTAFAADKFVRAMAGRNLQSSDDAVVAALDNDQEHTVKILFVGNNEALTYTVPAVDNGGGNGGEEQATEEVVLNDPHQLTVKIDQVGAVKVGQGDYIKDAVKIVLDIALSSPISDNENITEDSYIWKYLGVPSAQNESKLVSIEIDQRNIPLRASDGLASFAFLDSAYLFTAQGYNDVAIDLYNDFIKRDKHRVKIKFTDGTIIYEDEGYVERDDLDGNGTPGDGNGSGNGGSLAEKYVIKEMKSNWNNTAFDIDFTEQMTADDFAHLVSVKVNGEVIAQDKFILKSWGSIRTEDATAIALLEAAQIADVELVFDDASGGDTPGDENIADKYTIEKISEQFGAFSVDMKEQLAQADVDGIKQVFVNGETFDNATFFIKYGDELRSEDADVLAAFNKETTEPVVAITFADDSVLATDNYVPGGGTGGTINLSEIKKVVLDTTTALGDKEVIVILFDEPFTDEALAKLQSIEINGQTFSEVVGRSYSRANGDQLKTVLYLDNDVAKEAFNDTSTGMLNVVVSFEGLDPLEYQKEVFSEADKYGFEGFAEDKSIVQLSIYEHFYTHKQMLSIKLDTSLLSADADKVKSVQIEDETFSDLSTTVIGSEKDKFSVYSDALADKLTTLRSEGKDIDELPFILTFSDDSQLAKNARLQDNNKIDLDANLTDGEYTLSFGAYKVGTDEQSMMRGYFDRRAKLVVENGEKTISFALVKFADSAVDMALAPNGTLVSMPFEAFENGKVKVYSSPINDLTQRVELGALVDAGPLNASEGDIGNWAKYAKADIEFRRLTAGFDEFKYAEQARIEKERNLENITEALIANGVDTNDDGVISQEELQNAQGDNLEIYAGERKDHVIDLDGYHISDISLLKDLGPAVKHILLRNNDIEEIPANAFANATGLETILIENNKLSRVDKDAFNGLVNLKFLSMTTNVTLETLPQGLLLGNDKLEELYLNGCSLNMVGNDLLKGKTKLNTLFLQENKLTALADDFFADQTGYNLNYVRLSDNHLSTLPSSLGNAKNLSKLYAENNKITALPSSFATLNKLKECDFSHNQITDVPTQLLVNLSKLAQTYKYTIMVDFSDNYIDQLDLDAILAVQDKGNGFRKFNFELNNLWADLSDENKEKLSKLGVDFVGYSYKFSPQKSNAELSSEGVAGNINLTQTFDLAELYLWNDVSYNGDYYDSAAFRQYLDNQYKITKKPTREENLKAVLEANNINWKVQTIVTKDGEELYNEFAAANTVERLTQNIAVAMQDGEIYDVTKVLYIKSVFGEWQPKISNRTSFVARENTEIQEGEVQKIGVKALKTGQDVPSMMGQSINPVAKLALENGQYTYTLQTDMQIADFKLMYKGQPLTLTTQQVEGDYPLQYSFTVGEKITDRVNASFLVIIMNQNQACDLVFDYDVASAEPGDQDNRIVDAYILKTDKTALSMANESLDNNKVALSKKDAQTYNLKFKFNPMTIGQVTAGVTQLFVQVDGQFVEATALADGKFVAEIPASMVKAKTETSNTEIAIKFAMDLSVPGHDKPVDALLVLDWNGDYQPPQPTDPGDQDNRIVDAYILKTDKTALSMANESLDNNKVALSKKDAQTYNLKFKFNPMTIGQVTAGVTQLFVQVDGQFVEATALADGKFVAEIPASMVKAKTEASNTEIAIKFAMDLSVPGHDKPVDALLVLDWNGDYQPPQSNDDTTNNGNGTTPPANNNDDDDDDDDNDVTINDNNIPLGSSSTTAKVVAEIAAVRSNVRVVGSKVIVKVDQKSLVSAVDSLYGRAAKSRQVLVKAAIDDKANQVETVLTKAEIADIAAKAGASLKIDNQLASVVLSQKSLQNIANAAGQKVTVNTTRGADGELVVNVAVNGKTLTNLENGVTVEMANAKNKAGQVVVLVAADGSQTVIKKSLVLNGKVFAELPGSATVKVVDNNKVFDDVSTATPLYNAIAFASSHELFKGTSATHFSPEGEMTRAMLVTVLHRLEDGKASDKNYFADVAQADYYFDAVAWASENQIVEGYNGKFSPDDKITTEQLITILYRYMNKQNQANNKPANMSQFSDSAAVSDWAKDAIKWAVANDILVKGSNKLNPQVNAKRAEVAYYMQKIVELQLSGK